MTRAEKRALRYTDYFEHGSLLRLWRAGHPYGFEQTYDVMKRAFGYEAHYVNFGYWPEGTETHEAGREMALMMGRELALPAGGRLVEGGSGLGQAAVDISKAHELSSVLGMNPCVPQVCFANALARTEGLAGVIEHRVCDATEEIFLVEPGSVDGVVAMECIGVFPDPGRFIAGAFQALRPGGRIVFTVITTPRPAGQLQHAVQELFFGTRARAPRWWQDQLEAAGFEQIKQTDITDAVFPSMFATVKENLRGSPELRRQLGPMSMMAVRLLIERSERGLAQGSLGYEMYSAIRP